MQKSILIILYLILTFSASIAQNPTKVFQTDFDFGGQRDESEAILISKEGNYLVSGINIPEKADYLQAGLVYISADDGSIIWRIVDTTFSWTTTGSLADIYHENTFLFGKSGSLLKMDYFGNIIWNKTIPTDQGITLAVNNEVVITTPSQKEPKTVSKFSLASDLLDSWLTTTNRVFNTVIYNEELYEFGVHSGGNITNLDGRVTKYDLNGNIVWQNILDDYARFFGTVDEEGNIYVSGTHYPSLDPPVYYKTDKYDSDGNLIWTRLWDGNFDADYSLDQWVDGIIPYPGGGCVVVGSLTQPNDQSDANYTDFGAIAYNDAGDELWTLRFQAHPEWIRNDLWAAAWDQDNYLILLGSAYLNDANDHRYLVLTKWFVPGITVGIEDEKEIPTSFHLAQNYPNPFNPITRIEFEIIMKTEAKLTIYNIRGEEVAVLVDEVKHPGQYEVLFNGSRLPSGTYFYRLRTEYQTETKKMILLK